MLNHQRRETVGRLARFSDSSEESYARLRQGNTPFPSVANSPIVPATTSQLEELFGRWRLRYAKTDGHFVSDGNIGSDEDWWQTPVRVLFLTKEAHDFEGFDHDLRKLFRTFRQLKQKKPHFEYNVGRWAYGLHCSAEIESPLFAAADEPRNRHSALLRSAVVNLKKIAGSETANPAELGRSVRQDGDLIREQIGILNPDVVACGGTWKLANSLIRGLRLSKPYSVDRANGRIWLSCFHPTLQGMNPQNHFSQIVNLYRNSLAAPSP